MDFFLNKAPLRDRANEMTVAIADRCKEVDSNDLIADCRSSSK